MQVIGDDFRCALKSALYAPRGGPSLGTAIVVAIGLVILNSVLQVAFGTLASSVFLGGAANDLRGQLKAMMVAIFPAGLITAAAAYGMARIGGGAPAGLLALRWPRLGIVGWLVAIGGFFIMVIGTTSILVTILGVDLAQYTPGPNGQTPESGSTGLIKETLFDLANEPLFWVVLPSVVIGAPLAEEMIFRGQIFAILIQTRIGGIGTALITSGAWAMLHATEPWLTILMIFVMGLILSFLLIRFGSLWVTVVCHGLWNGLFVLVIGGGQT